VALPVPAHGRSHSLSLTLPPLGAVFLKPGEEAATATAEAEAAGEVEISTAAPARGQ
jgi:hypothetical protein